MMRCRADGQVAGPSRHAAAEQLEATGAIDLDVDDRACQRRVSVEQDDRVAGDLICGQPGARPVERIDTRFGRVAGVPQFQDY